MGYHTEFTGQFDLDKPLTVPRALYLLRFAESRRMKRDAAVVAKFPDPLRKAVRLPVGDEGGFYVGTDEGDDETLKPTDVRVTPVAGRPPTAGRRYELTPVCAGQRCDASVVDFNGPPAGQPGLWCKWAPGDAKGKPLSAERIKAGTPAVSIVWNEAEKFYDYVKWLEYLIGHFLAPWGYRVSGRVEWQGEDRGDAGVIEVTGGCFVKKLPAFIPNPELAEK